MRFILLAMIISYAITDVCKAQQWNSVLSLDSRVGYSTNIYLNPFLAEWDPAVESGYNLTSVMGQTFWYKEKSSLSMTGGVFYEPLFESGPGSWKGALGLADFNYRFTGKLRVGIEAGASYLNNSFSRTLTWVQPKVTWFISPFSLLRLKAGSNFRTYKNFPDGQDGTNRFDLYALEFETWPGSRWQVTAGLYGGLNSLPDVQEGFNARTAVGYHFRNGASLNLFTAMEQYQIEIADAGENGPPGGGFPPGGPSSPSADINTDRFIRFGLNGSLPINKRFSLFGTAERLQFYSETSSVSTGDYQVSGGIRFNFEPKIRSNDKEITPVWQINSDVQEVRIQYSGEGRIYLVGDFNNWKKTGIPLRKQSRNTYVTTLSLPAGAYEYKILHVQGDSEEWFRFSGDTYTVEDGFGSENAMLLVE